MAHPVDVTAAGRRATTGGLAGHADSTAGDEISDGSALDATGATDDDDDITQPMERRPAPPRVPRARRPGGKHFRPRH